MSTKSKPAVVDGRLTLDLNDNQLEAAARAALATGLTVPQFAKAAIVSKLNEFTAYGEVSFGPGMRRRP